MLHRRRFLGRSMAALIGGTGLALIGCRGQQVGVVIKDNQADMVGSRAAGAETYKPLIAEAVGKLLARQSHVVPASMGAGPAPKRICFVGVENKSAEELCDFRDQIVEAIDNQIVESKVFQPLSRRYVQAGLRETRLRPDELFLPANQRQFLAVMEQQGQPFDYLLFATLTSGTTRGANATQRDYLLTLELVNINTGEPDKESATLRKGYFTSRLGVLRGS